MEPLSNLEAIRSAYTKPKREWHIRGNVALNHGFLMVIGGILLCLDGVVEI